LTPNEEATMKAIHGLALAGVIGLLAAPARAGETGPHKMPVAEWGEEEYHLEVVPDTKAGTVTVYVYGGHDDLHKGTAKAIDAKSLTLTVNADKAVVVKLEAAPAKGDPAGKASVFTGKHAVFSKEMKWSGSVSGKVGTKPYSGDFGK
jgi:hypothetical protein